MLYTVDLCALMIFHYLIFIIQVIPFDPVQIVYLTSTRFCKYEQVSFCVSDFISIIFIKNLTTTKNLFHIYLDYCPASNERGSLKLEKHAAILTLI